MAAGSHSGWNGLEPAKRVCGVCGERLTLRMHLWIQEYPVRVAFHAACRTSIGKEGSAVLTTVWWEEDERKKRDVLRYCLRCGADARFDIVSPQGTGHRASEFDEGATVCGIDATGREWWWRA